MEENENGESKEDEGSCGIKSCLIMFIIYFVYLGVMIAGSCYGSDICSSLLLAGIIIPIGFILWGSECEDQGRYRND